MSKPILVYITTSSEEEAKKIASVVVEERLAACANILPGMKSIYKWEGKIEQGDEVVLLLKTMDDKFEALEVQVKALHSYDVPCIVALAIEHGSKEFLEWVNKQHSAV